MSHHDPGPADLIDAAKDALREQIGQLHLMGKENDLVASVLKAHLQHIQQTNMKLDAMQQQIEQVISELRKY